MLAGELCVFPAFTADAFVQVLLAGMAAKLNLRWGNRWMTGFKQKGGLIGGL